MLKKTRKIRKVRPVAQVCLFCEGKTAPDVLDTGSLSRFLSERGKILSRERSGLCSKHQRALTRTVKRARHLALLPFVVRA
ncbi:30S ribosomal protein S18 [Patescibacteria group bacterium]|nr:30S ribosomal protein S18 [Patescibacteria group bacterium]